MVNDTTINAQNNISSTTASQVDLKRAVNLGLITGLSAVLISAMGIVEAFSERTLINPNMTMGYLLLMILIFGAAYFASSPPKILEGMQAAKKGSRNILAGLLVGVISTAILATLLPITNFVNLRDILLNMSPALSELLSFGQSWQVGVLLLIILGGALGTAAGASHLGRTKLVKAILMAIIWTFTIGLFEQVIIQILTTTGLARLGLKRFLFAGTGGLTTIGAAIAYAAVFYIYYFMGDKVKVYQARNSGLSANEQRRQRYIRVIIVIIALAIAPLFLGSAISEILNLVGLFLLMGLGLNIVVGFAGLLDLGYVAFFAVGAYTTAVLTSPSSPMFHPETSFWLSLPFVVLAAAFAGLLVGAPVLRMRGDYLAIVTLGFGEIARLLAQSDWFKPALGGAQGILRIPNVPFIPEFLQGITDKINIPAMLHNPVELYYPILVFCLLGAYVSIRLQDSRIGRAWMAMREDEPVAEVMGINIVTAKLLAFIIGAAMASFSGAIFASKIGSIFPHSFNLQVSITVLVLIIVGGMGSIPGVVVGALVIVGVPQLLRQFEEFREFFYGILLIAMMRLKPEGLLPSKRRSRELHEDEAAQDAWLKSDLEESLTPAEK